MEKFKLIQKENKPSEIVLIYPFRPKNRNMHIGAAPPLGLLYLATYLNENNLNTTIIDLGGEDASDEEIIEEIIQNKIKLVGFPIFSFKLRIVHRFINKLKQSNYNGKIVLGAQHATALPIKTMQEFKAADYLIRYEAEISFKKLAEYIINNNGNLQDIENLYYRENEEIKTTFEAKDITKEIDSLPFPDRSLLDKYYKKGLYDRIYLKEECDYMMCSRGCPFRCNFCFPSSPTFHLRSPENIIKELKYLKSLGRKHIEIMDDTFTITRPHLEKTLNLIIQEKLNFSFKIRSRVDLIDQPLLKLMKKAGVKVIVFGVESGSERMLKEMNKLTTPEKNAEAIRLTKKEGISCFVDLFVGYPGETKESLEETKNFLIKTKPTGMNMGVFVPLPCTVGYETAKKENILVGEWSCNSKDPFAKLNWIENDKDLWKEVKRLKRKFYLNPLIFLTTVFFLLKNVKFRNLTRLFKIAKGL
jgi:anaerobic magnesium-protoporphyrin IX monomethyl ester cyclase